MIIVLFHVLYLLGKFVYQNYQVKKQKSANDAVNESGKLVISERAYRMRDPEAPQDYEEKSIRFFPPAYVQRYVAVSNVLNNTKYQGKLRKVVDFGCAELDLLVYLKNTSGIEQILCVDIDRALLESNKEKGAPLVCEYLSCRTTPLVVEIYEGSVTHNDKKLENTDAVICIELIEHVYPDTLTDIPYNIFGFIKPKLAVITTPNADFNVLFPNFSGFRHPDHKFEWTRQQFQDWAENITLRYPDYVVTFDGICKGPEATEHLGCCTQMAVFHRISDKESYSIGVEGLFKTVAVHEYPFRVDNRSDEQKILDEATYFIRHLSFQDGDMEEEVPLNQLLEMLKSFHISVDALRGILEEAGWSIADREDGPAVLVPPRSTYSDFSIAEGALWPGYSSFDDEEEDVWDRDPGPPLSSHRLLEQGTCPDNWDEEPSIIIPQNNSIVQDNTYLFDGELALDSISEATKDFDISEKCTEAGSIESLGAEPSLSSNAESAGVDDFNDSFDRNAPSDFNDSIALSNSFHTKLEDIQEDSSLNLMYSSNAQDRTTRKFNRTLDFQIYMSCSRASTSPEPFLLQTVKMDQQSRNNSMCNQSMSEYWTLNNSFDQTNTSKDTKERMLSSRNDLNDSDLRCMYLNSSYKENEDSDFESLHSTNGSTKYFTDQTQSVQQDSVTSTEDSQLQLNSSTSLACSSAILDNEPQFTSSPKVSTKVNGKSKKQRSLNGQDSSNSSTMQQLRLTSQCSYNSLDSSSEVSLPSNSDISISAVSTISYTTLKKWCNENEHPMSKEDMIMMKSGKPLDTSNDNTLTDSEASTVAYAFNDDKDSTKQLSATSSLSEGEPSGIDSINDKWDTELELTKEQTEMKSESQGSICNSGDENVDNTEELHNDAKDVSTLDCISASVLKDEKYSVENEETCKDVDSIGLEVEENVEAKPYSPEAAESHPNSWSPEIMDSGYPNSASAPDMTPEYDLSSVEQDHVSDSDPPSIAEAPRLGVLEVAEIENGDLANNNRDEEGNNMMAMELNELEDLQALIDVLENDLENENDIYALENGFPVWLLRILNMANPVEVDMQIRQRRDEFPAGEARYNNMEQDEGFDSSSKGDSDLENDEMVDDNSDANENVVMASIEDDNEHSDSGSDQWAVGET